MRAILIALVAASAVIAAESKAVDCSRPDKNTAQCLAIETRKLLRTYRGQISGHIRKNEAAYQRIAARAAQGRRDIVSGELRFERSRRSERLAAEFTENRRPVAVWKDQLKDYADTDWRLVREQLEQESVEGAEIVSGLASLRAELSKVDALDVVLASLAERGTLIEQLEVLTSFAKGVKTEFDNKVCAGLKQDLAGANKAVTALTTEIAALPAGSAERAQKETKLKAAQAEAKALTQRRTEKKCTD